MSNYPTAEEYAILYARYFNKRSIHELISKVPNIKDMTVADICCGGGNIAIEVAMMGAKDVFAVDSSIKMLNWNDSNTFRSKNLYNIHIRKQAASLYLKNGLREFFNIIFCRQAINYWLNPTTAKNAARCLQVNGYLVFNTFNQKPPDGIQYKKYSINGRAYLETNQVIKNTIYHTQHCDGIPPHQTNFKWISKEDYHNLLDPYFNIDEIVDGKTSIYVCKKKN